VPTWYAAVVDKTPEYNVGAVAATSGIMGDHKVSNVALTGPQVAELLGISAATWRGWVSKGLAPTKDLELGANKQIPLWTLKTLFDYAREAPGGRLGYPVG
jgi:hypothetical protein